MAPRQCSAAGCTQKHYAKGFCSLHYQRWQKRESLEAVTAADRFWKNVDRNGPNGCWLWTAGLIASGYGQFWDGERKVVAHRHSFEMLRGAIPPGLTLDHLCRVRRCVNPDHLEPVTRGENVLRGVGLTAKNAAKTHCAQGHPFDEANTFITERGHRRCRICQGIAHTPSAR